MVLVQITLINGWLRSLTTRAVAYGSVLCALGPEGQEALHALLQAYQGEVRHAILFTEFRNLSDLSSLQPALMGCGFTYEDHLNYLIDLNQPRETLWRKLSKGCQQSIRTGRNKGTVIEEATDRRQVEVAYQLLSQVYSRVRVPLASSTLFEAAFDLLGPRGMFKIWLARANEQYIGVCLTLMHNRRILDWYAAADRSFAAYGPGELLIWQALEWGQNNQFQQFDFGGAGKPDENYGPRKFKAKFGGALVNYGRNVCVHAPLALKVSTAAYALMQRFSSMTWMTL
jgi:serine/alanine adding enzyme